MFGLFKKKSEIEKLQESYSSMLSKAHKVSHSNRTEADRLMAEAEEIAKKIDALKNKSGN
ncbi:Lacal_2735 family protein [Aquiflexum lacus]|uniref:Lacal_2735 family protein n=1 Tax=Aquiflexum lacus TaxID=2483805 RepID=UPI001893244E|nr:Lacal_2735 family protein [Aquiflexum lacus]